MRLAGVAIILAGLAGLARADWSASFGTDADLKAKISIPFSTLPPSGAVPVHVTIKNSSRADRSWQLRLSSSSGNYRDRAVVTQENTLSVPAGSTAQFDFLMTIAGGEEDSYVSPSRAELIGRGVTDPTLSLPMSNRGSDRTRFVGMSSKIAVRSWEPLSERLKKAKSNKQILLGDSVEVAELGRDWRGYLGIASLWLTDGEFEALPPAGRQALRDWLLQGGEAVFFSDGPAPSLRREFGADAEAPEAAFGLGRVFFRKWNGTEVPPEEAAELLKELHLVANAPGAPSPWMPASMAEAITWNIPVLTAGILAFAILVGPVNLFWFARSGRRQRLFWTTPLISVIASLGLGVLIVVQDGFGGLGTRVMVTYVDAALKREVVLQQQASRTGVIVGNHFPVDPATWVQPVEISGKGAPKRNSTYWQADGKYFGDWFSTRWRQAQFLEALRPTRAEVRVTNAGAMRAGAAPEVLSSLPFTLRKLFVVDGRGQCWSAENLRPGQKATLRAADRATLDAALRPFRTGGEISAALERTREATDFFYAIPDGGGFLPTLAGIRWKDDAALYLGPLAGVTPGAP